MEQNVVIPQHKATIASSKWEDTVVEDRKARMLQILQFAGKDVKPGGEIEKGDLRNIIDGQVKGDGDDLYYINITLN